MYFTLLSFCFLGVGVLTVTKKCSILTYESIITHFFPKTSFTVFETIYRWSPKIFWIRFNTVTKEMSSGLKPKLFAVMAQIVSQTGIILFVPVGIMFFSPDTDFNILFANSANNCSGELVVIKNTFNKDSNNPIL